MTFAWRARVVTTHSTEKGREDEGSCCAQHCRWARQAAPCTVTLAGKASSTEMLNFFLLFYPSFPILLLPSLL